MERRKYSSVGLDPAEYLLQYLLVAPYLRLPPGGWKFFGKFHSLVKEVCHLHFRPDKNIVNENLKQNPDAVIQIRT
jgi:hypothetical protein